MGEEGRSKGSAGTYFHSVRNHFGLSRKIQEPNTWLQVESCMFVYLCVITRGRYNVHVYLYTQSH